MDPDDLPDDASLRQTINAKMGGAYGPQAQADTGAKILSRDPDANPSPILTPVPVGDAMAKEKPTAADAEAGPYPSTPWGRYKVSICAALGLAALVWFLGRK